MKHATLIALVLSALLLLCAHAQPSVTVTVAPTTAVTVAPTAAVTESPTTAVTEAPTTTVTESPTMALTIAPSPMPSSATSDSLLPPSPSSVPTTALEETAAPTGSATTKLSPAPSTTSVTTNSPTVATADAETPMPSTFAKTPVPTDLPSLAPAIFDDESPSKPGTPILTGQPASTTVSFRWVGSTDNVAVARYDIYDGPTLVGNTTTNSFTATNLSPNEQHSFTIVALDDSENESPASDSLVVHTLIQVDDFDDKDNVAEDNWGLWLSSCDGTLSNGGSSLQYLEGVGSSYDDSSFGARLDYEVDGGEWGFCNLFLDLNEARYKEGTFAVDLTMSNVTGIQFQLKGSEGSTVSLQLGTPLAEYNWIYYRYDLEPTSDWQTVSISFGEFIAEEGVPYTILNALESATTLVWEVSQVGRVGWFMIDNVDFMTSASNPEDVISGAVSLSLVVSMALTLVVGILI